MQLNALALFAVLSLGGSDHVAADEAVAMHVSATADVSMRDYLDARMLDLWRALDERQRLNEALVTSQEQAIKVARQALEQRLEGMNEFRAQLTRQAGEFASREMLEARFASLSDRIDGNSDRVQGLELRIAYYVGAAGVLGAIVAVIGQVLVGRMGDARD